MNKLDILDWAKIIIIVVTVFLCTLFTVKAEAVEWHTANQITVLWDPIPKCDPNDTACTSWVKINDILKYQVYTKKLPNGPETPLSEQESTAVTITFPTEGKYIIGVSAVRYVNGVTEDRVESPINWSDQNGQATPNPFGARFFVIGDPPMNLRNQ